MRNKFQAWVCYKYFRKYTKEIKNLMRIQSNNGSISKNHGCIISYPGEAQARKRTTAVPKLMVRSRLLL